MRLYDFTGLVELRIVGALRNRLSLQHIRQVINRLRASYDRPLTELRFAVQDRNLYFSTLMGPGNAASDPARSSWPKSSCSRRSAPTSAVPLPSGTVTGQLHGLAAAVGVGRVHRRLSVDLGLPVVHEPRRLVPVMSTSTLGCLSRDHKSRTPNAPCPA